VFIALRQELTAFIPMPHKDHVHTDAEGRLVSISLQLCGNKTRPLWMHIVCVYAPCGDKDGGEAKNTFFKETLPSFMKKINVQRNDILVIGGDFNSTIGTQDTADENVKAEYTK